MQRYGLILAGGRSSRMGFDKSKLNFHGASQVQWLYNLLTPFCEKVFVSGSPNKLKGDYLFIEDYYESGGPMNGILSAFRLHPEVSWLVVPVDMPNINQDAIQFLIQAHHEPELATCFTDLKGTIEPLPVILNHPAYPILLSRFINKQESLFGFLQVHDCNTVTPANSDWLKNVNDQSQL